MVAFFFPLFLALSNMRIAASVCVVFLFVASNALAPPGSACKNNSQCDSGSCKGDVCCLPAGEVDPRTVAHCIACTTNGTCSECDAGSGYIADGGVCVRPPPGAACPNSTFCVTEDCRGGHCCADGMPSSCLACGTDEGDCTQCVPPYQLHNGMCYSYPNHTAAPGFPCNSDNNCSTNFCFEGHCCAASRGSGCTACERDTGKCLSCADFYVLVNGNCVYRKPCTSNAECDSNVCIDQHCCVEECGASGISKNVYIIGGLMLAVFTFGIIGGFFYCHSQDTSSGHHEPLIIAPNCGHVSPPPLRQPPPRQIQLDGPDKR